MNAAETKKATPGPWFVLDGSSEGFDGSWCVVASDNCAICSVADTAQAAQFPRNMEANACLISAAPDFYVACKPVLREVGNSGDCAHDPRNPNANIKLTLTIAEIRAIYAAMDKAEGRILITPHS